MERRICRATGEAFTVRPEDLQFYSRLGVPAPTMCPAERERLRLAFRNDHNLYKRNCSSTGRPIVAMFSANVPFPVYANDVWWGDSWDANDYGREFDFSRPFFEQFAELQRVVPHYALYQVGESQNSAYTHHAVDNKDCHLCFSILYSRDCLYSENIENSNDCIDCTFVHAAELCYECVDCIRCYRSFFLQECFDTRESAFCRELRSCESCIGCTNLVRKSHCIFNEPVTKEAFAGAWREIFSGSEEEQRRWRERFEAFALSQPRRGVYLVGCENAVGDRLEHCKDVYWCFDCYELEDCAYTARAFKTKSVQDAYATYAYELSYFVVSSEVSHGAFASYSFGNHSAWYVEFCQFSHDLFGCVGMKKAEYCILNRQYSKEGYQELRSRVIEHMAATGEWGEFFPLKLSPFGYNESTAADYYPLSREEAIARGANWYDEPSPALTYQVDGVNVFSGNDLSKLRLLPDDQASEKVILCSASGKPFKLAVPELRFYRTHGLPLPGRHPTVRYRDRLARRTPRKLWQRPCTQCRKETWTSYGPDRQERIVCPECFELMVY